MARRKRKNEKESETIPYPISVPHLEKKPKIIECYPTNNFEQTLLNFNNNYSRESSVEEPMLQLLSLPKEMLVKILYDVLKGESQEKSPLNVPNIHGISAASTSSSSSTPSNLLEDNNLLDEEDFREQEEDNNPSISIIENNNNTNTPNNNNNNYPAHKKKRSKRNSSSPRGARYTYSSSNINDADENSSPYPHRRSKRNRSGNRRKDSRSSTIKYADTNNR